MDDFVHLHVISDGSFLDGTSSAADLVNHASKLGMRMMALTERNTLTSAMHFVEAAKEQGIKPIFGAEITLETSHSIVLLVKNDVGWRNLSTLITLARRNAPKGKALLFLKQLKGRTSGLIALSSYRDGTICASLLQKQPDKALSYAKEYIDRK